MLDRLHDEPSQPVRVRLSNNSATDVIDSDTVFVGPTSATVPVETVPGDHGNYVVTRR